MMKSVKVELPWEAIEKIVIDQLQEIYFDLNRALTNRKNNTETIGYYHNDSSKDILEISKHIEAVKLVLEDYGIGDPDFVGE